MKAAATVTTTIQIAIVMLATAASADPAQQPLSQNIPVSAPIATDSTGRSGNIAIRSVMRVVCPEEQVYGTGFLHKSGDVLTADHVVKGCQNPILILANGAQLLSSLVAEDPDSDLALLKPSSPINATPLAIASDSNLAIGTQVSTWGFPAGYGGSVALLSIGYMSGKTAFRRSSGKVVEQWVVNAAFNSGNSGGPLIDVETGQVVGVVDSKLAPISPLAQSALTALEKQKSGFMYPATAPNGARFNFSEAQVIGTVLKDLRSQVQLVIGMAVTEGDIRAFLQSQKIDP